MLILSIHCYSALEVFHGSCSLLQNPPFWKSRMFTVVAGSRYCCCLSEMKHQSQLLDLTKMQVTFQLSLKFKIFESLFLYKKFSSQCICHITSLVFLAQLIFIVVTSCAFLHHIILGCVDDLLHNRQGSLHNCAMGFGPFTSPW